MSIPNRQIGWGTTSNLLWRISQALDRAIKVASSSTPATTTTTTTAL